MENQLSKLFRNYLHSTDTIFAIEAHNGVSAKIAQKAGFKILWASGLSIATSLGVRDCNELTSTEVLNVLSYMVDSVNLPIIVDGDTGYGNYNNFRRFVKKINKLGIASVCIEDKVFPKTNSFVNRKQNLVGIEEFCGKIKAGKDVALDSNFSIIARTESLILGFSIEEALMRAEAYHKAGADAILIHSSKDSAYEVLGFVDSWNNKCPVVVVPTKYYATNSSVFKEKKISIVIWANHLLRASMKAMQETCAIILKEEGVMGVENKIASLQEVFDIVETDELLKLDDIYLPV
jgi:phosphoenolpyruvate mutase